MKTTLTILLMALASTTFGQITTTKVSPTKENIDNTPYDSLDNFAGKNARKYVGQELYLKELGEDFRKFGYRGFVKDYTKDYVYPNLSNVYQCCDNNYYSKYDALNGKYFKVLEVIKHPKAATGNSTDESLYADKWFLKLQAKENKDIVYYEYNSSFESGFPFIVVGYFEKAKKRYIGKDYVLRGRNWIDGKAEMHDIQNGKPIDFSAGTIGKCVDITIEEKFYELALILENNKGERIALPMVLLTSGVHYAISKIEADKYRQKFGNENWTLILSGKAKIGMTKEMCKLSWGEPQSKNETITAGKKTEQWVYADGYLYFDNGILIAMQ